MKIPYRVLSIAMPIVVLLSMVLCAVWFFVWPDSGKHTQDSFGFFVIRYGHSLVWLLMAVASLATWIQSERAKALRVGMLPGFLFKAAGLAYATFLAFSYVL